MPNASAVTNAFDSMARLTGTWLKHSSGAVLNSHTYGYNLASQRTVTTNSAGNYLNYTYDKIGELKTAKGYESGGSSRLQEQFGYGYDPAGNLNSRTNNALVQTFGVNNLNELTNVTRSGSLTVAGVTSAAATSVTVADNGNSAVGATLYADKMFARTNVSLLNGNNTFTSIAQDSYGRVDTNCVTVNLPATVSYIYDLNGNLTTDGTRAFDYDDENQLIRVTVTNSWKSEFTYDGRMRRRIRKEFTWSGTWVQTGEVHYIYDAMLVIQERDGNNLPMVTYTRGHDLSGSREGAGGIGGMLSRTDAANGQTACYHADGNGNVTTMVNAQQIVVAKYIYDPFGNTLSKSGMLADANIFRFSSKEYHANSGLYYYGYRFYDPNLQRWLNRDPIMEQGGMNLYTFARNRRPAMIDSFGFAGTIGPAVPPAPPGEIYPLLPTGPLGDASDIANFEMGHAELPEEKSYYLGDQLFDAVVDFLKHVFGAHPEPPNPNPPPPATPVPVNCPAAYPKLPTPVMQPPAWPPLDLFKPSPPVYPGLYMPTYAPPLPLAYTPYYFLGKNAPSPINYVSPPPPPGFRALPQ